VVSEITTVSISKGTKERLDVLKSILGNPTYDELLKKLTNPEVRVVVSKLTLKVDPELKYEWWENYVKAPFTGVVRDAFVYFPPGCEDLVSVWLGVRQGEYYTQEIKSGDGKFVPLTNLNVPVLAGNLIWAEIENRDLVNPHTPTIEVTIVEKPVVVLS